ncbi:very short patch repair endonuclease [Stenotrophomonas sp. Marseille-Q4652]|uniref:very short patch repair endonuclease n=1 Tax=Stenotrophomonas sp. Marseille-Q4652 TaxID=2866595 RepID=UPI001CE4A367|nr:very short patch repair endonuclease [Stenotrophomonas sp. Marseille-Q4652]
MSAVDRSALMSRIRGKNTAPEVRLRKILWRKGLRYRLHGARLPGRPDLVFPRWRAAVFVHGCFWHRHTGCPLFRLPKTRTEFWEEKLRLNQQRDSRAVHDLVERGWKVAVAWECAIRSAPEAVGRELVEWIRHGEGNIAIEADGTTCATRALKCARS